MFGWFQWSTDDYVFDVDRRGLMFVREFPAFETAYRTDKDEPTNETWAYKSGHAQLVALGEYVEAAGAVLGLDRSPLMARVHGLLPGSDPEGRKQPRDRYAKRLGKPLEKFDKVRGRTRLVTSFGKVAFEHQRVPTLDHYKGIAATPDPDVDADRMLSDEVFAHLRVAGMNPVLLREPAGRDHVAACGDPARIASRLSTMGDDLDAALAEGRLFVVDPDAFAILHAHLVPAHEPEHPPRRRYLAHPTAVFVRPAASRHLLPVSIRCGEALATLTPDDPGELWARAKLHYAVADCMYHTFVSHLAHTHYPMEPVVIAARRAFGTSGRFGRAWRHPIGRLLEPHIVGTLAINRIARGTLLDGSSPFGDFVVADVESTIRLMAAALEQRRRDFVTLPEAHALPRSPDLEYPFRDDFARVGAVLGRWVQSYVDVYYADDLQVRSDRVLEHFREEVRRQDGIASFPRIWDKANLVRTLTTVVQIASIQHASIHFPQTDIGRLAIVSPFYAADVPPGWNMAKDRAALIDSLPRLYAARWQAALFRLSNIRWRCLETLHDRFGSGWGAPELAPHVETLKRGIVEAGRAIERRNARLHEAGLPRYRYMQPDLAPCSINA